MIAFKKSGKKSDWGTGIKNRDDECPTSRR